MRLVPLSREHHGHLRVDPAKAGALAANVHLVPLVLGELRKAAAHYPLFFAKDAQTGQFYLAALMGLEPHENLYWDGSALDAAYVPLNLMRQPFYAGGETVEESVICIDEESPALDPNGSCAILEADGSDSRYIATIQTMLSELARQQAGTRAFIDAVVSRQLLMPVKLDIRFDNGSGVSLDGLYGVDERALERRLGEIGEHEDRVALFALLLSMEHVAGLVRRRNKRDAAEAVWLVGERAAG